MSDAPRPPPQTCRDSHFRPAFSGSVSLAEAEAALARERRPRIRKRLAALCAVLAGKTIGDAAQAAKTSQSTVRRSLQRLGAFGLEGLLLDRHHRRPPWARWSLTQEQRDATRRAIAAALLRPLKPDVRARLVAIDMVLSGRPIPDAAASARVHRSTASAWLRLVARDGLLATLARWEGHRPPRPRVLDADPAALRALAATERDVRFRKQHLALALVAEGMSPHAAGIAAGVSQYALWRRIRLFRQRGIASCLEKPRLARPKKLSPAQLQELHAELRARPETDEQALSEFIAARFGVRYSAAGLRLLLKREFAIPRALGIRA